MLVERPAEQRRGAVGARGLQTSQPLGPAGYGLEQRLFHERVVGQGTPRVELDDAPQRRARLGRALGGEPARDTVLAAGLVGILAPRVDGEQRESGRRQPPESSRTTGHDRRPKETRTGGLSPATSSTVRSRLSPVGLSVTRTS